MHGGLVQRPAASKIKIIKMEVCRVSQEYAIELKNITKRFGKVTANDKVCLSVKRGEILSILGENGSGKTTLMNMISGIYYPDEGQIFVNGKEAGVSVQIGLYDGEDRQIALSDPIDVSLRRSYHTILRGSFLMQQATGGIVINPDFDGNHNIVID